MGAAKIVDKTPYEKVVGVGVEIVESKRTWQSVRNDSSQLTVVVGIPSLREVKSSTSTSAVV